ncbi:cytochrome c3 family protein [Kaarinaea lacus]
MWRYNRWLPIIVMIAALFLLVSCSTGNNGDDSGSDDNKFDHRPVAKQACVTCHNKADAAGKNATHIASTNNCDSCHTTSTWVVISVDHNELSGSCITCHNGKAATGKPDYHLNTSNNCEACHYAASGWWIPIIQVDHGHVVGNCESCHNNSIAVGKGANHIATTQACDVCHNIPPATWLELKPFDHSIVRGQSCVTAACHDTHKPGDTLHVNVTDNCAACHTTGGSFTPPTGVDHSEVSSTCDRCHDGNIATGKGRSHISTSQECNVCHLSTTNWRQVR